MSRKRDTPRTVACNLVLWFIAVGFAFWFHDCSYSGGTSCTRLVAPLKRIRSCISSFFALEHASGYACVDFSCVYFSNSFTASLLARGVRNGWFDSREKRGKATGLLSRCYDFFLQQPSRLLCFPRRSASSWLLLALLEDQKKLGWSPRYLLHLSTAMACCEEGGCRVYIMFFLNGTDLRSCSRLCSTGWRLSISIRISREIRVLLVDPGHKYRAWFGNF